MQSLPIKEQCGCRHRRAVSAFTRHRIVAFQLAHVQIKPESLFLSGL